MRAIWKYQMILDAHQEIEMPAGAEIRHVGIQAGEIAMWVEVDTEETTLEPRSIRLFGTGMRSKQMEDLQYIGTVQQRMSFRGDLTEFVWHIYEETA